MIYSAVTIDTNVVSINGYNLEGGLLARLYQFNGGTASFILSEIVVREINRHLIDQAKETRAKLDQVVAKSNFHGLLDATQVASMREISAKSLEPRLAARNRIDGFIRNTDASIVKCEETNIRDLVRLYFDAKPPFELSGKKKSEFPDAIALLSLETWARANNKKILAISNDNGWKDYAGSSDWIDVESDIAKALQLLQKHAEEALKIVTELINSAAKGGRPDIIEAITDYLADEISSSSYYAEADAVYRVGADLVEGEFISFEFQAESDSQYGLNIVETGDETIVAKVKIDVVADFKADFSFYYYDSVDKEDIWMGNSGAHTREIFELSVLLTLSGDFKNLENVRLTEVEAVDMIDTVDFGHIEMDYGEPDEWDAGEARAAVEDTDGRSS